MSKTLKRCTCCKKYRRLSQFNRNKRYSDGLNTICRACSKERSHAYYARNREQHKETVTANKKRLIAANRERILAIKKLGCTLCPENDPVCIDFHHRDPAEKNDCLAKMLANGVGWERLQAEIDKCDRVCANCHRKIHASLV